MLKHCDTSEERVLAITHASKSGLAAERDGLLVRG